MVSATQTFPPGGRPAGSRGRGLRKFLIARGSLLVLCLAAWELAARTLASTSVPTVGATVGRALTLIQARTFWAAIGATLQGWVIGMLIAATVAIPVGLAIGSSPTSMRISRGVVEFFRTVPSIMLVPLVVLMFGSTIRMKVVLIVLAAVWPLMLQSAYGVREVDRVARESVDAFGVAWRLRVVRLYLPSATPFIATGLRVASTIALLISIGAEIITSAPGIGYEIAIGQANGDAPGSFALIVTAALIGVAISALLSRGERSVLFWHSSVRAGREQ